MTVDELKIQYMALMAYINNSLAEMTNLDSTMSFNQFKKLRNLINYERDKFQSLIDTVYRELVELKEENERLKKFRDIVRLENEKLVIESKIKKLRGNL